MVAWLAGCGKISFGEDRMGGLDAAPGPDVVVIPDAGEPDTGVIEVPDTGVDGGPDAGVPEDCLPVTVPTTFPTDWPFGTSREAYEQVFWSWASMQVSNCSLSACHGGPNPPRIPVGASLGDEYRRAIMELWPYLKDERTEYSGKLWRHHADYAGPGTKEQPYYDAAQITFLKDLVASAWACQVAPALARQDAGPECGPEPAPPDAGADPDAGDAGVDDAGAPDGGARSPCYCDVPDVGPLNTANCAQ
jgi:hypothetical protein